VSKQLTIYMTPVFPTAVTVSTRTTGGRDIYLLPVSWYRKALPKMITIGMLGTYKHPLTYKHPIDISIVNVENQGSSAGKTKITNVNIFAKIPRSPWWKRATFVNESYGSLPIDPVVTHFVDSSNKDDYLLILGDQYGVMNAKAQPGERIVVTHETHGLGSFSVTQFYRCKGLTSGIVRAKYANPNISGAYLYDVECEGQIYLRIAPTDFVQYSVNQTVRMLRGATESGSLAFDNSQASAVSDTETLRIAPLQLSGV
jgi:hypothetical protein